MNFKKRFLVLCMLLSFSFIMPESANIVNEPLNATQTVTVVKAKKKTTTKKATKKAKKNTKAKKSTTTTKKEKQVYVTPTGKCYHTHACGRGSYSKASLSYAKSRGLRACKKCY